MSLTVTNTPMSTDVLPLLSPLQQMVASYLPWQDILTLLIQAGEDTSKFPAFLKLYTDTNRDKVVDLTFTVNVYADHDALHVALNVAGRFFSGLQRTFILTPIPTTSSEQLPFLNVNRNRLVRELQPQYQNLYSRIQSFPNCQITTSSGKKCATGDVLVIKRNDNRWPNFERDIRPRLFFDLQAVQQIIRPAAAPIVSKL